MNLWVLFITGLTVGGLTCLAVQGGLLASIIAAREEEGLKRKKYSSHVIWPTAAFLVSKLTAYTILGFILGIFGGAFKIPQLATAKRLSQNSPTSVEFTSQNPVS